MHKILVPIDRSENAARALDYALKLAMENGPIELHLVTVHPEPEMYGEILVYITNEKIERLQKEHSEDLLRPAEAAVRAASVPYTSEILIGDVALMIVKRANELNCDSIIMGTRGMSAIGNLVMGSVATKVVHLAKCPVTLVK